jgi:hypothetical protein
LGDTTADTLPATKPRRKGIIAYPLDQCLSPRRFEREESTPASSPWLSASLAGGVGRLPLLGGLRGISPLCHGDEVDGLFPQAESDEARDLAGFRWQFYYCAHRAYCGNCCLSISARGYITSSFASSSPSG